MAPPKLPRLDALDVDNRRVFVRVDFNVPLGNDGTVRDDTRIRAALPTLRSLRERGARLVVASHLGRPKGRVVPALSMEPVAARLAELLDCEVRLPDEVVGDAARRLVLETRAGQITMLENLRFHPGETSNDPEFAKALAELADAYVNDAFGTCHRAHASVVGVPRLIPERAAGRLLAKEVDALSKVAYDPAHPFVAIVGGAKVSDKAELLDALVRRLGRGDAVLVGGAMANTFLYARGEAVGASLVERDATATCRRIVDLAAGREVDLLLPVDAVVARSPEAARGEVRVVGRDPIAEDEAIYDIGPATAKAFAERLDGAATVFWNGPMGMFESPAFAEGTLAVARAVAACEGFTVVGGGDSLAAVAATGVGDRIDHLSTGGGASLAFVEGRTLPGIAALTGEEAA
ncbi:MAG: phosphoglycerate kinase [Deltaproteobacteria bacterium]|nr:MAG: phosphoglycerate kinase [Deltaproteobacteria bacterium]